MDNEALHKLTSDLKKAVETMTPNEARFLVDAYYQMQDNRIRADGQIRSMSAEPHKVLGWLSENTYALEKQVASALRTYALSQHMGRWAMEIVGIGPIIAAGLLAHIDITKAPTVGHIWSFAGLDPTKKWKRGEKRPWNASLKVIAWKIGESFIKFKNHEQCYYGHMLDPRKEYENQKNLKGEYAEQAKAVLASVPNHAQKAVYKDGKLPVGHIHSRAKRYVVKQFLSDWHAEAYRHHFGKEPPKPYPIAILGHAHERKFVLPSPRTDPASKSESTNHDRTKEIE